MTYKKSPYRRLAIIGLLVVLFIISGCVRDDSASEVPVAEISATVSATRTPTASPTESATAVPVSPTPTDTATPSPTQTATATVTATRSPTPTATPITVRLMLPERLQGHVVWLDDWMQRYPERRFVVASRPDSQAVLEACANGRADIGLYEGSPSQTLAQIFAYAEHPVAAVVSFTKPLEQVTWSELTALAAGDAKVRASLNLQAWALWEPAARGLVEQSQSKESASSVPQLIDWVRDDHTRLALVPYGQVIPAVRALRIDGLHPEDEGYAFSYVEAVVTGPEGKAAEGIEPLARDLARLLREKVSSPTRAVHVAAVGDMMLARDMGNAIREYGAGYPFQDVRPLLVGADLTMGNLECVISDRGEPEPKAYTFQAPLTATQSLIDGGFDLLNVANNHILDFGVEAMAHTFELLQTAGIAHVGAGMDEASAHRPVIKEIHGLEIGFLGYARYMTETSTGFPAEAFIAVGDRPGIAWADIQRMQAEVSALQEKGVDLIVVALHGGREYWERPTEFQQQAAHALIDAGADLVWGHHAHSWQGIEFYGDGVALYSLGDFVFDQMTTNDTAVAHIWLDRDGVRQIALSPVHIVENGRPTPAKGRQGRAILDWLYGLTALIQE